MIRPTFVASLLLVPLTAPAPLAGQEKPTVRPADYGKFERVGQGRLSPDGKWLAYGITRVDDRVELRIRKLAEDSTRVAPLGTGPIFSADSRWLAWAVGVTPDERQRLEREKKPVRTGWALLDLTTGRERSYPLTAAAGFDATGRFFVVHGYPPDQPKGRGADLRVVGLAAGTEFTIGNVAEFSWSGARSLLAYTVATGTDVGNGIQVYDAESGRLRGLDGSGSAYRTLGWREDGTDLAVYRSIEPASKKGTGHVLLAWRALEGAAPARLELDSRKAGLADSLEIVEHRRPEWSPDGRRISLGIRPRRPKPDSAGADTTAAKKAADELPGIQIWHTRDVRLFAGQKVAAAADGRRTMLAVWEPDADRVIPVGTDVMQNAGLTRDWSYGIERDAAPYGWGTMFGRPYHDVWVTDLATGARARALTKVRRSWESPAGRYLLWFDGKDYRTRDLRSGKEANLTAGVATAFADTGYDTPTDQLPPHGVGGWIDGDRAVLLYDRYDVWRVNPDGTEPTRLTNGAPEQIVSRAVQPIAERRSFDPKAPIYLSLHGEWTEKRGYARLDRGRVERLVYLDQAVTALARADSAEVMVYRAEARDDSPDFFVAGPTLADARQVSRTNPFLGDYAWGKTELIDFTNERGRKLQGVLLYPANHDPARKYPMIVYTYEMLSQDAHSFRPPSERDYYSMTAWTQQGYFVLMPDIVFRARDPGVSVVETLRPAVSKVADMGLIDPKRVGLIGHSWGGYTATFVPTRTDIFAASVAGAPLTDFVSFMGQIHWNQGSAEVDHWETGQARMEVPYWEDPEAHHRNSPIHKVHEMKTPLLMAFGDADGVVDWDQGTEFYNFARRAGKQMVLLVYEGENHGFSKQPNQIDYHRRILEWFGHYLKGEPAPGWITDGIPLERLDAEKRRVKDGTSLEVPKS